MNTVYDTPPEELSLSVTEEDLRDQRLGRIEVRAHERYEARGGEHGQDVDDWLQAEHEIDWEIGQENRQD